MEYLFLLGVYIVVCIIVSSFFSDREIGSGSVFLLSLFLSPIIGILIGLSSKRIDEVPSTIPSSSGKDNSKQNRKNEIISRLEEIKRMEGVDLGTEELSKEKEELKKEFQELENTPDDEIKGKVLPSYDNLEEFHQMIFRERLKINNDNITDYIKRLGPIKVDKRFVELQTEKFDLKIRYEFVKFHDEELSSLVWLKFYGYK